MNITYRPYGPSAILIEWPQHIDKQTLMEITNMDSIIKKLQLPAVIETVPAYASLTVFYEPSLISYGDLLAIFTNTFASLVSDVNTYVPTIWEIRVHYELGTSMDVQHICSHTGLTYAQLIDIHVSTLYAVHFIGFLPGFLYLGGLDQRLHTPRKSVPSRQIPKGAVAIGGAQTGIYPQQSPGGWYVIGITDFQVLNFDASPYCKIKAGDQVKFVPL